MKEIIIRKIGNANILNIAVNDCMVKLEDNKCTISENDIKSKIGRRIIEIIFIIKE
jgi:hypothetical protein